MPDHAGSCPIMKFRAGPAVEVSYSQWFGNHERLPAYKPSVRLPPPRSRRTPCDSSAPRSSVRSSRCSALLVTTRTASAQVCPGEEGCLVVSRGGRLQRRSVLPERSARRIRSAARNGTPTASNSPMRRASASAAPRPAAVASWRARPLPAMTPSAAKRCARSTPSAARRRGTSAAPSSPGAPVRRAAASAATRTAAPATKPGSTPPAKTRNAARWCACRIRPAARWSGTSSAPPSAETLCGGTCTWSCSMPDDQSEAEACQSETNDPCEGGTAETIVAGRQFGGTFRLAGDVDVYALDLADFDLTTSTARSGSGSPWRPPSATLAAPWRRLRSRPGRHRRIDELPGVDPDHSASLRSRPNSWSPPGPATSGCGEPVYAAIRIEVIDFCGEACGNPDGLPRPARDAGLQRPGMLRLVCTTTRSAATGPGTRSAP